MSLTIGFSLVCRHRNSGGKTDCWSNLGEPTVGLSIELSGWTQQATRRRLAASAQETGSLTSELRLSIGLLSRSGTAVHVPRNMPGGSGD